MKLLVAFVLFCLALAPLACGGSEPATSSAAGANESSKERTVAAADSPRAKIVEGEVPVQTSFVQEGPFAGISFEEANQKPHIDPANRPPPRNPLVRNLKRGTGPAARLGDRITAYYAGAVYETGRLQYYGWPPANPMSFELGGGIIPRLWKLGFTGLRAGGVREVVAPSRFFGGSGAVDYVMVLISVDPA